MDMNSGETPGGIEIFVNARPKTVTVRELSFEDVIGLADGLPSGPNYMYTVAYTGAGGERPEGTLVAGQSVRLKEGMAFNVRATDLS